MLKFLREWHRWSTLISCVVRRLSRVKSEQSQGGEKKAAGKKLGLARISGSGEVAPRFTRVEQSRVILFDVAGFLFCTWPRVILPFSFSYSLITQQQWSAHSKATKTLASSKKSTKSSSGGRFVPVSPPAGAHAVISARERVHFEEPYRTDLERIYSHLASRDSSARTPQNRSFRSGERSRSTTRPTLRARSSTPSSRKSSRTANPVTPMARESLLSAALFCGKCRGRCEPLSAGNAKVGLQRARLPAALGACSTSLSDDRDKPGIEGGRRF